MKIISYYTIDTPYEAEAQRLRQSLERLGLDHKIYAVANRGSWQANTTLKPKIIQTALDEFAESILYVDADATFHRIPNADWSNYVWGAHIMDKAAHGQNISRRTHSLMSGTLWFSNTIAARYILDKWLHFIQENPNRWDQRSLEKVWMLKEYPFLNLPIQYCAIDRTMKVDNAVIRHHQASRRLKGKIC